MLYHISSYPNLTKLTPRIPKVDKALEDTETARVCFAPSINRCLRAICADLHYTHDRNRYKDVDNPWNEWNVDNEKTDLINRMLYTASNEDLEETLMTEFMSRGFNVFPIFYVYMPVGVNYEEFTVPTKNQVFDVNWTKEVWLHRECEVAKIATIMVTGAIDIEKIHHYREVHGKKRQYTYWLKDYEYRIISDETARRITLFQETIRAVADDKVEKLLKDFIK